ncbi:MAG: hypothetical protein JSV52_07490 [Candidatus Zixiibacteriota bacterium]|nr:MAG: hypothetical protein JSV52_07490 [candidate division Zixibacteria bacterium]
MKKVSIFVLILLFMIGSGVLATDTRVLTMGDNNMIMLDDANIWLFPSRFFEYPNLAIGEFSNADFTQFGIHWKFGKDNPLVVGTYFTDLGAAYPTDLLGGIIDPFDAPLLDNRRIDFFYGNEIGGFNFGSHFAYYSSSQEVDAAANQEKESFGFYDLNFGLTSNSGSWDIVLNVGFGNWTDEDVDGNTETEPDGFTNFGVMGRYFWQWNPNYTLVPHAGFFAAKRGIIDNIFYDGDPADEDRTDKYKLTGFDLGIGANYTPTANVLAVCDFGFLYEKWKHDIDVDEAVAGLDEDAEETYAATVLPYFKIGLDADVFKWMDVRFGATSYWVKDSDKLEVAAGDFELKSSYADNDTYLGFGFHWKRLHIDTYTDPQLFLDGLNFISGSDIDMNFRISAVYEMM